MKKLIIFGAAGFIGSNLISKLDKPNTEILLVDNLSTGKRDNIPQSMLDRFIEADITDIKKIYSLFTEFKPEYVINLAAQSSVATSMKQPLMDIFSNIFGASVIAEACARFKTSLIHISSGGAIYDEDQKENPSSYYGLSKSVGDMYFKKYYQYYGLQYTSLRPSNVYGPNQDGKGEAGVISIFLDHIKKKEHIEVFGTGEQTRDFIYVGDLVQIILDIIKNDRIINDVLNVSTGVNISINQLIDKLSKILGQIEVLNSEKRVGDLEHSFVDNTNLKEWFSEFTPIEKGLKLLCKYNGLL